MKTTGVFPEALAASISRCSRSETDAMTSSFRWGDGRPYRSCPAALAAPVDEPQREAHDEAHAEDEEDAGGTSHERRDQRDDTEGRRDRHPPQSLLRLGAVGPLMRIHAQGVFTPSSVRPRPDGA